MRTHHVPYLIGLFMLLPYAGWLIAWAVFLPGPKSGFDVPMALAMIAVTVPLVAWFFFANLGFVANSMAGRSAYHAPSTGWVSWLIARMPLATVAIGLATVPYLLLSAEPPALVPLPLIASLAVAWTIRRGERARAGEAATREGSERRDLPGQALADRLGRIAGAVLFRIPIAGPMLREALYGSDEDRTFFAINLALTLVLIALLFGIEALFVVALVSVPLVFGTILALTAGD